MRWLRSWGRGGLGAACLAFGLALPPGLPAQPPPVPAPSTAPAPPSRDAGLPIVEYTVGFILVGVVMLVVCTPARRE